MGVLSPFYQHVTFGCQGGTCDVIDRRLCDCSVRLECQVEGAGPVVQLALVAWLHLRSYIWHSVVYWHFILSLIIGAPINEGKANTISSDNGYYNYDFDCRHRSDWHQRENDLQQGVQTAQCRHDAGQLCRIGDNDRRSRRHLHPDQARVQASRATQRLLAKLTIKLN